MCDFGYFRAMNGQQDHQPQQPKSKDRVVQVDYFQEDMSELLSEKRNCESHF